MSLSSQNAPLFLILLFLSLFIFPMRVPFTIMSLIDAIFSRQTVKPQPRRIDATAEPISPARQESTKKGSGGAASDNTENLLLHLGVRA